MSFDDEEDPATAASPGAALVHGAVGFSAALLGASCSLEAWRCGSRATALAAAERVNLHTSALAPPGSDRATLHDGAWLALTGVAKPVIPLRSLNGTPCACIWEVDSLRPWNPLLFVPREHLSYQHLSDAEWQLSAGSAHGGGTPSGGEELRFKAMDSRQALTTSLRVIVDAPALSVAAAANGDAVRGLPDGGSVSMLPQRGALLGFLAQLLGDHLLTRSHHIIAAGASVTVLGRVTVSDGVVRLTSDPAWGMYLLAGTIEESLQSLRTRTRVAAILAGCCVAVAVSQYMAVVYPGAWRRCWALLAGAGAWVGGLVRARPTQPRDRAGPADGRGAGHSPVGRRLLPGGAAATPSLIRRWSAVGMSPSGSRRSSGGADASSPNYVCPEDLPWASDGEGGCIACLERCAIACLLPCGHLCLCMTCARRIQTSSQRAERRCPICREGLTGVQRVFGPGSPPVSTLPVASFPASAAFASSFSAGQPAVRTSPLPASGELTVQLPAIEVSSAAHAHIG